MKPFTEKIRKNNEILRLDKIRTVIFIKSEVQLSGSPLSKAAEAHILPRGDPEAASDPSPPALN